MLDYLKEVSYVNVRLLKISIYSELLDYLKEASNLGSI